MLTIKKSKLNSPLRNKLSGINNFKSGDHRVVIYVTVINDKMADTMFIAQGAGAPGILMLKTQFEKVELLSIPVDALFSTFEVLSCWDIPISRLVICILEGKVSFCKGTIVSRCCEDEEGKAGMFV